MNNQNNPSAFPMSQMPPSPVNPAEKFGYDYHPLRNYCRLIFHEYYQGKLTHLSQAYRNESKVPKLGTKRITKACRSYALDIVDQYLTPDLTLLTYDYILNCPNSMILNLKRTVISRKVMRLMHFQEQRELIETFIIAGVDLKKSLRTLSDHQAGIAMSYEDIRSWHYFFFNLTSDSPNAFYPKQLLLRYLKQLQHYWKTPGILSILPDPRTNEPLSLDQIYHSNTTPLDSYSLETELLAGTKPILEVMAAYQDITLKPLKDS